MGGTNPALPVSTPEVDQSLAYHSIRFYRGEYNSAVNVPYRYGDESGIIADKTEKYYDTWDDFHLIPTERPTVAIPAANTKLVTIPGKSVPIDFTTYLTGHPTFANRSGQWSFYTDPDFINSTYGNRPYGKPNADPDNYLYAWLQFEKTLRNALHGHISKVVLRDDPSYFYVGELTLNTMQPGTDRSTITISYNLYPYKKSMTGSLDFWKWDDFDFRDGIIMYLKDLEVHGQREVVIYGSSERISPRIIGSTNIIVDKKSGNKWIAYGKISNANSTSAKSAIVPRLIMDEGKNTLRFSIINSQGEVQMNRSGTVTIDYRRGLL